VTLLGGKLTARSQVGKGSAFRFGIEVGLSEGGDLRIPAIARRVSGLLPGQPQHRILLVDDDSDSRDVFRRVLEQTGFHVLEAGNGQEAVDLHATRRPDLILMDLRMPVMDGHEAARRMRDEQGREIHTPIIAVTAHVMERGSLSAVFPEFDDLVRKPAAAAELFEKIGRCLDVTFVYQGCISESENEGTRAAAELSSADLSVLPRDWLEDFSHASRTGRSRKLLDLIDRIQPAQPDLGPVLTEWVRSYRFDRLIAVVEEAPGRAPMNSVPSERVKGNLLVVDDDLSSLRTMEALLGREGYDGRCAPSGQMALTFAHEDPPELILLDIRLPDMDGFQVCRSLRGNQKTHAIPVIFISALDERADKVKGFAAGGVDYITKPF
jgi:CheY-like chemotaxis protein